MSVSLQDVIEDAGYDIKNNLNDAIWFVSKQDEFQELLEECEYLIERFEENDE